MNYLFIRSVPKLFGIEFKEKMKLAESITTIYLGFKKNLKDIYPNGSYSTFFLDSFSTQDDFITNMQKDIEKRNFVFVDYSRIDSGLTDNSKSFGAICIIDKIDNWEKLNKSEYKIKKEELLKSILTRLEKYYPDIKSIIEYAEVATPKTIKRYIKTPNGTAYGYKPTPEQFFRIPQVKSNKIDNLYFSGQFVISGGFSASIISGNICYEAIKRDTK